MCEAHRDFSVRAASANLAHAAAGFNLGGRRGSQACPPRFCRTPNGHHRVSAVDPATQRSSRLAPASAAALGRKMVARRPPPVRAHGRGGHHPDAASPVTTRVPGAGKALEIGRGRANAAPPRRSKFIRNEKPRRRATLELFTGPVDSGKPRCSCYGARAAARPSSGCVLS